MGRHVIDCTGTTPASPEAVWALLGDSATWPAWTPVERHRELSPGRPPDGTGEVRLFTTGRVRVREEVVVREPGRRLAYVLLGGLAVRDYRAEIDLTPTPEGGTHIRWHTTFRPKLPGTGGLYRRGLTRITQAFVDGLAAHAVER